VVGYKKVAILGCGRSGRACASFLLKHGVKVLLSDINEKVDLSEFMSSSGVEIELGGHTEKILDAELIILSPGIPPQLPVVEKAMNSGIPVVNELEFGLSLVRPRCIIGITGTNGKTTTTALVGHILEHYSGEDKVVVAGNIGSPISSFIEAINDDTILVLEISSYQLETSKNIHVNVACILNIAPDHLGRHKTMEEYVRVKEKIFMNQTWGDWSIFNYDDAILRRLAEKYKDRSIFFSRKEKIDGICIEGGNIVYGLSRIPLSVVHLPGEHNVENVLAAVSICYALSLPQEAVIGGIDSFRGVEHRLEFIGEFGGVRFINDSKATNVDSVRAALESLPEEKNIILIMGGRHKGSSYTALGPIIQRKVKYLLLIGEAADVIYEDLKHVAGVEIVHCGDLRTAVSCSKKLSKPGDIVLLSPGCASFDQFVDFEDRGRKFKEFVREIF